MKYDIFISYRREGGYDTAKHLYDLLVRDGYKVSFDIDTLRSGDFDTQLLERIDQCKDFILIVDQHAFDRTLDPNFNPKNDWLRCELAYALKQNKNIIPVFLSGVKGFPSRLPDDIVSVTRKNGPEFNRYHFNSFYEILKSRFLHKRTNWTKIIIYVFILLCVFIVCTLYLNGNIGKRSSQETIITEDTIESSLQIESSIVDKAREDALKLFCGEFAIVAPGSMKDGITWVYEMELDPVNSTCSDADAGIENSKGWCGTMMQMPEVWEVYSFSLHNSLKYAIVEMRRVDDFYDGENKTCKLKLELDEFNNIKMSYLDGNDAPSPLYGGEDGFTEIATFYRE